MTVKLQRAYDQAATNRYIYRELGEADRPNSRLQGAVVGPREVTNAVGAAARRTMTRAERIALAQAWIEVSCCARSRPPS